MNEQENKMGVMPVNRLLVSMALPMVLSMLVQALYNVVDSIFVAKINEYALTAVSLAFPVQNLMIGVAVGTGVGVNALLSRSLGEKKEEAVRKTANNAITLALLSALVFMLFGLFFSEFYFRTQTDIEEIVGYGRQYLTVICLFSFGCFTQIILERLLQATGRTMLSMLSQGTGAVVNLLLDPVFIFGLFGMPRLGVTGAAVATVIGQLAGMFVGLLLNLKKNPEIRLCAADMRPDRKIIGRIYAVGLPSIVMNSVVSVMTFALNRILIGFSSTATTVLGVYFKLQSFVFMPVFGLNNAMVPIIAYNYGARKRERIMKTITLSAAYAVGIMLLGLAVFELFPEKLLRMFEASEHMLAIGIPALRTICTSFLFAGFCIVCSSVYQALGNSVYSLLVSVARQLLVLVPSAYLLSLSGKVNLVWFAFPIAELVSVLLCIFFLRKVLKKLDF